jgi:hypothetical protein
MDKGGGEMSAIKDAKPGERWEFDNSTGIVVAFTLREPLMAIRRQNGTYLILTLAECGDCWRKTHNADGTRHEEPREFGECWAARDEDGGVCLHAGNPFAKTASWISNYNVVSLGKISFRPELPWDKTACKVRVRLEVVE